MKKKSLQSYKVQCRTKTELKTTNQIPKSPLRMSSLVVVHCNIARYSVEGHESDYRRRKIDGDIMCFDYHKVGRNT